MSVIEITKEGATLVATVSRPEAMNALNGDVLAALGQLIEQVKGDSSVRVVVITGKGEKAFVAGADIKQFDGMNPDGARALAKKGQVLLAALAALPQPVIAAVNGFALGGGLELALACDLIIASENAKFALPECTLGLIPGFGGTVRLPRLVGTARALEMAMTGAMLTSHEALQCGLVNRVVPQADLMKTAMELANTMASRAPIALQLIKRSIHEGREKSVADAEALEADLFGKVFATADKVEGVSAFLEKRKPQFAGR